MVVTVTVCAALNLEEGLRPACAARPWLGAQSHVPEVQELRFAVDRILAVLGGGAVALAISYVPGWRPEAAAAARGARESTSG